MLANRIGYKRIFEVRIVRIVKFSKMGGPGWAHCHYTISVHPFYYQLQYNRRDGGKKGRN